MVPVLLAFVLAVVGDVFTVDDDGPADFGDLQAAVDGTTAGDVLLVEPGTYGGFELDTRRTLLGRAGGPRPVITGPVTVDGPATFHIAGFELQLPLAIRHVPGRVVVDDCVLGLGGLVLPGLTIGDCREAVLSRLQSTASAAATGSGNGQEGVLLEASRVQIVACTFQGNPGFSPAFGAGGLGGDGLAARSGSVVMVAGSTLVGGDAGLGFPSGDGTAGDGLRCNGSTVVVRGGPGDVLAGGAWSPGFGATPGHSLHNQGGAVVWSGVTLTDPVSNPSGTVIQASAPEPYVTITGSDLPGDDRLVQVVGPAGATGWLVAGFQPTLFTLGKLEGPLWTDPGSLLALFPVPTSGEALPVEIPVTLPAGPGLEGLLIDVQLVFPSIVSTQAPGKQLVTNDAPLLLRF
jgi:hypothetical protein